MFLAVKLPSNNNVEPRSAEPTSGRVWRQARNTRPARPPICSAGPGVEQQIAHVEEERRLLSIEERPDPRDVPEVAEPNHKLLGYFRLR